MPDDYPYYTIHENTGFSDPVLVVSLEGWVDAGLGAATALTSLLGDGESKDFVTFDGDHFLDFRARRPIAKIIDGVNTELNYPRTQIRYRKDPQGKDVLFLIGPEPDFHWRDFLDCVVGLSGRFGVRQMVGLGAFPAPAPHTRPIKLAATAPEASKDLIKEVGIVQGELEVPAGVLSALEHAFAAANIPAISLWARVPHYVSGMPFPDASAALVDGLNKIGELAFDSSALKGAADSTRRQVDELLIGNPDHTSMVKRLEENIDASEGNPLGVEEIPSGDELAEELERFLRSEGQ